MTSEETTSPAEPAEQPAAEQPAAEQPPAGQAKQRFLVMHDYGMGGLWWWMHARSAREIRETFAELEIIDDPGTVAKAERWQGVDEVDIDTVPPPVGLTDKRATRDAQRGQPGFGALADRQVVHLRQESDWDGPVVYLSEVGPDGRRIRQVEVTQDGTATRGVPEDWPFNPPIVDLFDPSLVDQVIDADEFERAWDAARWGDDHEEGS